MNLGKVVGTVVSTRKEPVLDGIRFLLVRLVDTDGQETSSFVVAADAMGAGPGEMVLTAAGSSARQTTLTQNKPVDTVIMAIVDTWEINGKTKYIK
ncbi:MAG: EutN/CcmL family microcompartment protein [Kiritimatiellae bacterium]|jgi:microcompartment protein CcmK/EutM|nr:EutN/CcmL family microcompartment protein [Kiritimatiellia bacterium]NLD90054.1 EutN/CcmL family microcompartment protein [Lentisphaerota bacterium]HOU21362.1 EutN/CcmL family microcompartment protein [Kiritimatiellia bacterium]HPC20269.1 EutN/CcmL family microcompartment protein [Kiritimatiellia bacterium]HQN80495.1 EutN/CcmL family microcompartment protein [Kiritimatiellia bacterium]